LTGVDCRGIKIKNSLKKLFFNIICDNIHLNMYSKLKEISKKFDNVAFLDGQNLYFGTTKCEACAKKLGVDIQHIKLSDCTCGGAWAIDDKKFRVYLKDKYNITEAYYFLGYISEEQQDLYDNLQKTGFILVFKEHSHGLRGKKKGNVDSDIIFSVMKKIIDGDEFGKVYIVSGDGDYKKLVDFLIKKDKFGKMLFPNNKFASSLYTRTGNNFASLEDIDVKAKIQYTKN